MSRILKVRAGPHVPGQDTNLTLKLTPVSVATKTKTKAAASCKVAVEGIFWQDCDTGEFDVSEEVKEYVETAYDCAHGFTGD